MDPFSAAASAIGVISLAIQLADSINKLHEFWSSVRDAPQEVREITNDLKCLTSLLKEVANGGNHGPNVQWGLECCETKLKSLFNIVQQLDPNFYSSNRRARIWNSVKVTLKKNKLKEFRDSLEGTKTTLILALMPRCHLPPGSPSDLQGTKGPKLIHAPPEPQLTSFSKSQKTVMDTRTGKGQYTDIKSEFSHIASEIVGPDIQACMESALHSAAQLAAENLFGSGTFGQVMNDTVMRATTMQSTYHGSYKTTNAVAGSSTDIPTAGKTFGSKSLKGRKSRICHSTSATGTLFGKVWVRTTTVKVGARKGAPNGAIDIVTSFIFYPSWWLTKIGLGYGIEANLRNSSDGWQFKLNPVRAVPGNSLIFEFCHSGNLPAVQQLITRDDASVRDTSSKGWNPLHFAAEAANVEICEYLISAGADKAALVYEGPSKDTLLVYPDLAAMHHHKQLLIRFPTTRSPVTIFVDTAQNTPAERKIQMLRLFKDCLDLTEPDSEGWVIIGRLFQAHNKEYTSVLSNSINWVLQCAPRDGTVVFGHVSMWHGFQHAIRSLIVHEHQHNMLLTLLGLVTNSEKPGSLSRICSIARWLVLRVCERDLFPMIRELGAFLRVKGFGYLKNTRVPPAEFARTIPLIYNAWIKVLPSTIKHEDELITLELDSLLEETGWTRESVLKSVDSKQTTEQQNAMCCSACGDDYSSLGMGLVDPLWLAFVECTCNKHKRNCICSNYVPRPEATGRPSSPFSGSCEGDRTYKIPGDINFEDTSDEESESILAPEEKSNNETNEEPPPPYKVIVEESPIKTNDAGNNQTKGESDSIDSEETTSSLEESSWLAECEQLAQSKASSANIYPFQGMTTILYRSQGRNLLGKYELGEQLCGTCFLYRHVQRHSGPIALGLPGLFVTGVVGLNYRLRKPEVIGFVSLIDHYDVQFKVVGIGPPTPPPAPLQRFQHCFLKRERYVSKNGINGEDQYVLHPESWVVDDGEEYIM
ncbi:ankyrin repeat-containing protein [Rutstroemia sp. NJR-2017a WRK4]|nr:ankyrin repeat-containing protein [Rutstroemia sp. NJR-2017a WRK4]